MGELFNPYPELPKNIRQIGERDDVVRLYTEDYVNTYLKRLYPSGGQELRVGLLLGTAETKDGLPHLFVDGALEMENVTAAGEKVVFTEAAWKKAYQCMEETFPKRTVQGWFICGAPGCSLSPLNYWRQHSQYFSGKHQLLYLNGGMDGEEAVYVTSEEGFYRLKGYHIYYERNLMMQNYMVLRKDARRVESAGRGEKVIRDFRNRMEEHRQEAVSRRGTIRMLGTLCGMLSVLVLAGGTVMINNYQRMKEMEHVLVSVFPERAVRERTLPAEEEDIIVEEIRGTVTPETMETGLAEITGTGLTETTGTGLTETMGTGLTETIEKELTDTAEREPSEAAFEKKEEKEPFILPEPEAQNDLPPGGNSTAARDYPVSNLAPGRRYLIGEGETLYGICFDVYGSLKYLEEIRVLNRLDDDDHIVAGQHLILPEAEEKP